METSFYRVIVPIYGRDALVASERDLTVFSVLPPKNCPLTTEKVDVDNPVERASSFRCNQWVASSDELATRAKEYNDATSRFGARRA